MKTKAFLYIVIAGMLWGTSGIFVKFLTPYGFTAPQLSLIRGTVSFIAMLLYSLILDRDALKISIQNLIFSIFIGITLFGTATLYYSSMQMTSVSTAVVLMYTAPIYVTAFSIAFLGEKSSKMKLVSLGTMLLGCAFVSGVIGGLTFDTVGIVLGILSGIVYAAYNVLTKIALGRGVKATTLSLYGFLFMALTALVTARPSAIFDNAAKEPAIAVPLTLGLGIFTFVLPYFFYTLSMRDLPAGTASALSVIEPLAATVYSAVIFFEIPSIISSIGIILIIAATFMLGKAENDCNRTNNTELGTLSDQADTNHHIKHNNIRRTL